MSIGPQIVNYGNIQGTFLLSVSLTPTSVNSATAAEQTFTVPGILVGDQISGISFQAAYNSLVDFVNYRVSANNTLAITFVNGTAGSLTPPSGTYLIEVNRPAQLPLPPIIQ